MTAYTPNDNGSAWEWGKNDIERIYRLCNHHDKLQSRWSGKASVRHYQRHRLRRAGRRLQKRIRNFVDELHCKLVKWLVANFDVVLLPKFETQRMVINKKWDRKITSKTARAMMTLSHFRFRQRLLHKSREFPSCQVIICDEDYTSKTCGSCGEIHQKLGGAKIFKCPSCECNINRDLNGARNILLRYITNNTSHF